jgi:hypothetical protein
MATIPSSGIAYDAKWEDAKEVAVVAVALCRKDDGGSIGDSRRVVGSRGPPDEDVDDDDDDDETTP